MKKAIGIVMTLALAATALPQGADNDINLPVHVERFSPRVIRVWIGDYAQTANIIALASRRGLVVIDTDVSRSAHIIARETIEREFGRNDYLYVINTHQHYDHTNGNQLYPGVSIVAHRDCREGMVAEAPAVPDFLARMKKRWEGLVERAKTLDPETDEAKAVGEYIVLFGALVRDLENGHVTTYPDITFTDRMSLDLGDMTLNLYSVPGGHTKGDIFIHVPEESLLCIGDKAPQGHLPTLNTELDPDPDFLLRNWGAVVEGVSDIRHVIIGHSDMTLSFEFFKWQYEYYKTLWSGLKKAEKEGQSLEDVKEQLAFEKLFPGVTGLRRSWKSPDGKEWDFHLVNIEAMWTALKRGPS